MVIREMSKIECLQVLAKARLARLACAHANQPYVVPVYLAYQEASGCLYGFTTPGQKLEWMRANPLVCVEMDEVAAHDQWVSVIAIGRFEELPATPGEGARGSRGPQWVGEERPPLSDCNDEVRDDEGLDGERERERAWQVLKTDPVWWEPGCAAWATRAHRNPAEPFISVYYRIRIDRVTGHEATRDPLPYAVLSPPAGRCGWLRKTLTRVFGGQSNCTSNVSES